MQGIYLLHVPDQKHLHAVRVWTAGSKCFRSVVDVVVHIRAQQYQTMYAS